MKTKLSKKVITILIGVIVVMGVFGVGALHMFRQINEEKSFTMKEINEIQVSMSNVPVHIIRTEAGNEVKFHLYGKSMQDIKLSAEINNKTVFVEAKRKIDGPIPEDMFFEIYLPAEYGKNLSVKTSAGGIKMDTVDLANFTLDTSSGGLEAEQINAEKISIKASSGRLNIKKIDAKEFEIKGSSSAINIDECTVKEGKIETSSGGISLKNSSGNYDFKGTAANVFVAYRKFEDQNINIVTTSGSITLELPSTSEFSINAKTVTGKIQSDFSMDTAGRVDKKNLEGQIGTKNNKVSLQASTGSIKILKK